MLCVVVGLGEFETVSAAAPDEVAAGCPGFRAQLHIAIVSDSGEVMGGAGPADALVAQCNRSVSVGRCNAFQSHASEVTQRVSGIDKAATYRREATD